MDTRELLRKGTEIYNVVLDDRQIDQFIIYMRLLKEWNEKINLTAITEESDIIKKHFIDSVSIVKSNVIKNNSSIIDVGTGAGFPGIPIKIILPGTRVLLLDSLNKRINFLNEVIKELGLKDITTIHGRAEELSRDKKYREKFDIATARAVANLVVLSEYCIPYVKVGGYFLSMKGPSAPEEIDSSRNAIGSLGGKIVEIIDTIIPTEEMKHKLVVVEKINTTDVKFPRKTAQIEKKPIK